MNNQHFQGLEAQEICEISGSNFAGFGIDFGDCVIPNIDQNLSKTHPKKHQNVDRLLNRFLNEFGRVLAPTWT